MVAHSFKHLWVLRGPDAQHSPFDNSPRIFSTDKSCSSKYPEAEVWAKSEIKMTTNMLSLMLIFSFKFCVYYGYILFCFLSIYRIVIEITFEQFLLHLTALKSDHCIE